jgi:GTPase SAR1 family protein
MALRGVKPKSVKKRLKALFFGQAGVGKTTAAIQFPKPYLIDTEGGAEQEQYTDALEEREGQIFQTNDFDEVIKEVKELLSTKHDFKTLIIDPMTTIYNDIVDKAGIKVGTDFGRHYNEANKKVKHLLNLLLRLDMNVIITAHQKDKYGSDMSIIGSTFDCYKKLDYLFDLVFEVKKQGKKRLGIIRKSRIKNFTDEEAIDFCYEEIAKRYGIEIIEKEVEIEELATKEQVQNLIYLIDLYKEPEENIQKWKDKAKVESFDEMNKTTIGKIISYLEAKGQTKSLKEQWTELNK